MMKKSPWMRRLRSTKTSATCVRFRLETPRAFVYAWLISSPISWPTTLMSPEASSRPTTFCNVPARCRSRVWSKTSRSSGTGRSLIHAPGEAVSFVGLPPGSSFDDALDLVPHGLEVAEAPPQRRLQVRQCVEQTVVGCTPTQLLPQPLDRVQLRAVARQA